MRTSCYNIESVSGDERAMVFRFIQTQFLQHFDAAIEDDTQFIYTIRSGTGSLIGAFGLNRDANRFSCQRYLSNSELYGKVKNIAPDIQGRVAIVELCHLSVLEPRSLCQALPSIAGFLANEASYLVCTATATLTRHFSKRGFAPVRVAKAHKHLLSVNEQVRWGTYYDHDPVVVAGPLVKANDEQLVHVRLKRQVQCANIPELINAA